MDDDIIWKNILLAFALLFVFGVFSNDDVAQAMTESTTSDLV